MRVVEQSTDWSCGPACLAMVTGKSEKFFIDLLGHRYNKGVKTRYIPWCLDKLDILHSKWTKDDLWHCSEKAILVIEEITSMKNKWIYSHYVVWYKNKYYEPGAGIVTKDLLSSRYRNSWCKVKKYLDIYD